MKTKSQNQPNRRDAVHCISKPCCHPEPVEGLTFSRLQRRADTDNKLMPIFPCLSADREGLQILIQKKNTQIKLATLFFKATFQRFSQYKTTPKSITCNPVTP
jgi:hypothetical protein